METRDLVFGGAEIFILISAFMLGHLKFENWEKYERKFFQVKQNISFQFCSFNYNSIGNIYLTMLEKENKKRNSKQKEGKEKSKLQILECLGSILLNIFLFFSFQIKILMELSVVMKHFQGNRVCILQQLCLLSISKMQCGWRTWETSGLAWLWFHRMTR